MGEDRTDLVREIAPTTIKGRVLLSCLEITRPAYEARVFRCSCNRHPVDSSTRGTRAGNRSGWARALPRAERTAGVANGRPRSSTSECREPHLPGVDAEWSGAEMHGSRPQTGIRVQTRGRAPRRSVSRRAQ